MQKFGKSKQKTLELNLHTKEEVLSITKTNGDFKVKQITTIKELGYA